MMEDRGIKASTFAPESHDADNLGTTRGCNIPQLSFPAARDILETATVHRFIFFELSIGSSTYTIEICMSFCFILIALMSLLSSLTLSC